MRCRPRTCPSTRRSRAWSCSLLSLYPTIAPPARLQWLTRYPPMVRWTRAGSRPAASAADLPRRRMVTRSACYPAPAGLPAAGGSVMSDQDRTVTAVLDVRGMLRASSKKVVEAVLGRRPGVELVEDNPVAKKATVVFDPDRTSVDELCRCLQDCGYHCDGQSVPAHLCDPLLEPGAAHDGHAEGHADGHATVATPPAHQAEPAAHLGREEARAEAHEKHPPAGEAAP